VGRKLIDEGEDDDVGADFGVVAVFWSPAVNMWSRGAKRGALHSLAE
jgi:hypothetical protein